jgi:hypothetical protein
VELVSCQGEQSLWPSCPPLPFFALVIFQVRSHVFAWGRPWNMILLPMSSQVVEIIDMYHHTQLIDWDEVSLTFCPGWPQTMILMIFASLAAVEDF